MPSSRQVAYVCASVAVCMCVCVASLLCCMPVAQAVNYVRYHIELVRLRSFFPLSEDSCISHDFFLSSFPSSSSTHVRAVALLFFLWHLVKVLQAT